MAAVSVKRSIASTRLAGYFGEDKLYDLSSLCYITKPDMKEVFFVFVILL